MNEQLYAGQYCEHCPSVLGAGLRVSAQCWPQWGSKRQHPEQRGAIPGRKTRQVLADADCELSPSECCDRWFRCAVLRKEKTFARCRMRVSKCPCGAIPESHTSTKLFPGSSRMEGTQKPEKCLGRRSVPGRAARTARPQPRAAKRTHRCAQRRALIFSRKRISALRSRGAA